jgi:SOS-response transcriptional repressor LexA
VDFNTFNAIKADEHLKANEKYFYMLIVNYASEKGYAYPSYEQLMKDMGTTKRLTISNIIKRLVEDGYIKYTKGNSSKKANEYYPLKYITSDQIVTSDEKVTSCEKATGTSGKKVTSTSNQRVTPNKNTNKNKTKKIYTSDSTEIRLTEYLYKHILKNNPKAKEPNFQKWAKAFDLMIKRDNRELEEIKELIKFSQQHNFWFKNILSADSFREKYDRLLLEKNGGQAIKNEIPMKGLEDFF